MELVLYWNENENFYLLRKCIFSQENINKIAPPPPQKRKKRLASVLSQKLMFGSTFWAADISKLGNLFCRERMPGRRSGQIYSYPGKAWRKRRWGWGQSWEFWEFLKILRTAVKILRITLFCICAYNAARVKVMWCEFGKFMILPLMLCLMARYQYLQYFMLPKHLRFDQEVSACVLSSTSQTHMLGRLKDFYRPL